jgi:hypothetical protein
MSGGTISKTKTEGKKGPKGWKTGPKAGKDTTEV